MIIDDKKIFVPGSIMDFLELLSIDEMHQFFDCLCLLMDEKPIPKDTPRAVKMCVFHVQAMQEYAPNYEEESEAQNGKE